MDALFEVAPSAGNGCSVPDHLKPRPRPTAIVGGLDLSLAAFGMARIIPTGNHTRTVKTDLTGHQRLAHLREQARFHIVGANLVAIEGPSYGSQAKKERQTGHHERAGLWWMVTHDMWRNGIPYGVVAPATLKVYATGNGRASKRDMRQAARETFPGFVGDDNAADALWLAAMAAEHLGFPIAALPDQQRAAVSRAQWPVLIGDN